MTESWCDPPGGGAGPGADDPGVEWDYRPVEVDLGDGTWAPGRISGWWHDGTGEHWCRLRIARSGQPAHWRRFDPSTVLILPLSGL
ncbi:hypothetical protein ACIBCA_20130 [Kitasatospora sp. NPDC051170]|uniref:hypothetical protein n=1 Tax=Kitasatospora sp. NPDC051170 TaxID=3364056 RepID=UPI0037B4968E